MTDISGYGLDLRCSMLLEEFIDRRPLLEKVREVATSHLTEAFGRAGLLVTTVEGRVKSVDSLAGKLELKGAKYSRLDDITDLVGVRVVAFYTDDVDKVAAIAESLFTVDWANSVDKRKMHDIDSFGYNSLHYVCTIPESLHRDPGCPELNSVKFELQMRTALQHVWATMNHDTGYKSGVSIPSEYIRNINRLAGVLELADDEFSRTRTQVSNYRRQVEALVKDGKFDEVPLSEDTFRRYLELKPFGKLTEKIAAINQAEIHYSSSLPYLTALQSFGFTTLGDVERLIRDHGDDAYHLALRQIGGTDIDIISSTVAIQDLCTVYVLKSGGGEDGLKALFDEVGGVSASNAERARRIRETADTLEFMNR